MLFNSFKFIFLFLPLVLLIARSLRGQSLLRWIALSSFVFYAFAGQVWFLVPMFITMGLDFVLAQRIATSTDLGSKRKLLALSLTCNLGLLFYFKYSGLMVRTASTIAHFFGAGGLENQVWIGFFQTILPAGISFYTFQTIAYIVDVYRGSAPAETNFWEFASFIAFFPHLVAGPLTRHHQLIPGLRRIARDGIEPDFERGIFLFVIGLSKKVLIADRLGDLIDPMLTQFSGLEFVPAWLALFGYAFQIYFDFSGYSDMAIGLARLFGIELPQNFNSPYQAKNPSDYWNRWHITLSLWLKDYLYMPLVVATWRFERFLEARLNACLIATMFLGGLWHGANWTYGVWGLYHGFFLVLYHRTRRKWNRWPAGVQRLATFAGVTFSWVFFRAPNFSAVRSWLGGLFGQHAFNTTGLHDDQYLLAALVACCLIAVNVLPNASHFDGFRRLPVPVRVGLGVMAAFTLILLNYSSKFLYFQF